MKTLLLKKVAAIALFCGVLLMGACKKDEPTPETPPFTYATSPIDLQGIEANFVKDVAYDTKTRTKLDAFLPKSSTLTGMVIFFHGGGFAAGKKEDVYGAVGAEEIRTCLRNNIAFITAGYSLLDTTEREGVIKCLNDTKRAVQYVRSRAKDFNIDKAKIVLSGVSAGAGASLWIAFNNEMADANNADAVLRESTRVKGVAVKETQATYHLERWATDVFGDYGIPFAVFKAQYGSQIAQFYGLPNLDDFDSPANKAYRDKVDMLALLTADDPEFYAENLVEPVAPPINLGIIYHHAYHARALQRRATAVNVPTVMYYGNPRVYTQASGEKFSDFIVRKVKN